MSGAIVKQLKNASGLVEEAKKHIHDAIEDLAPSVSQCVPEAEGALFSLTYALSSLTALESCYLDTSKEEDGVGAEGAEDNS